MDNLDSLLVLGHVSAAVSHQVINSFSTIVSQAEMLRSMDGPSELAERSATITNTSLEASNMARRLIEFSRSLTGLETEMAEIPTEAVDLNQLITAFAADEGKGLAKGSAKLVLDLKPIPALRGRCVQLRRMLRNLVQNSSEASTPQSGPITLTTKPDARGWLVLEVRDLGSGMAASVLERAVEPFFSTKPDRLGVGLTVARGIWRRHRGTLAIESQPEKGTTIRLSAPGVSASK